MIKKTGELGQKKGRRKGGKPRSGTDTRKKEHARVRENLISALLREAIYCRERKQQFESVMLEGRMKEKVEMEGEWELVFVTDGGTAAKSRDS